MFRRFSTNFALFSMALDGLLIAAGLYLATILRWPLGHVFSFVQPLGSPIRIPLDLYIEFPIIWVSLLILVSVYDGRRNFRVADELGSLSLGTLLAMISMAGILFLTYREVSRFLFLSFILLAFCAMALWRLAYRIAYRYDMFGNGHERLVLILGATDTGRQVQAQIELHRETGLRLLGFLDDDAEKQATRSKVVGPTSAVRALVCEAGVDDVIVALPRGADDRLNTVVSELHDLPVRVWVVPDYFSLALHKATVEEFAGIPMLDLRAPALSEYQRMLKRGFDILVCLAALPFVLPVMALSAAAIRLDSPGPVFFRQKRVGENGRLFEMIKFRTMVANAEQLLALVTVSDGNGHLIHKLPDDPRVTRVGHILRATSLDELPQLLNVLRGEMSLVGPRPEMPTLVEKYELWQRKRFAVPQGMTGWWQVNGRSDKPMHLHTEEDLYYVQHYSIWLDLQILVKTIWVVLHGKGAY